MISIGQYGTECFVINVIINIRKITMEFEIFFLFLVYRSNPIFSECDNVKNEKHKKDKNQKYQPRKTKDVFGLYLLSMNLRDGTRSDLRWIIIILDL